MSKNQIKLSRFYVTNFPEDTFRSDLVKEFQKRGSEYGKICGVYPDRNERGKRYAFVDFTFVTDERALERNLQSAPPPTPPQKIRPVSWRKVEPGLSYATATGAAPRVPPAVPVIDNLVLPEEILHNQVLQDTAAVAQAVANWVLEPENQEPDVDVAAEPQDVDVAVVAPQVVVQNQDGLQVQAAAVVPEAAESQMPIPVGEQQETEMFERYANVKVPQRNVHLHITGFSREYCESNMVVEEIKKTIGKRFYKEVYNKRGVPCGAIAGPFCLRLAQSIIRRHHNRPILGDTCSLTVQIIAPVNLNAARRASI